MNLDHPEEFHKIDQDNMLEHINNLPNQLGDSWKLSTQYDIPNWKNIQKVVAVGMGGSAIAADLISHYLSLSCKIPFIVHRDYELPYWARGSETLVIACSHSGNTEETISAYDQAIVNNCHVISITTGGSLAEKAHKNRTPLWMYNYQSQPRAAIGYSFSMVLAILHRLNIIPNHENELFHITKTLNHVKIKYQPDIKIIHNPAKRIAGQLIDRYIITIAYGYLSPVARRWKTQINELAKSWANFEIIPEINHNTLSGTEYPSELLNRLMALFFRIPDDQSRNSLRMELTQRAFMLQGIGTDYIHTAGTSPLENMWMMLHLGDYVAYYLSMGYGVNPTPVALIEELKQQMIDGI